MKHTIFALASAQGRAGVSVIRTSGPQALSVAMQLTGKTLKPRQATYASLTHDGEVIDQAIIIAFLGLSSFTGEDSVEYQVHGSAAVLDRLYSIFDSLGFRLAEPGEFTRRALENGKLDLTQAEAIVDLVDAESEAQRRQALTQLDGGLKRQYEGWRQGLIDLLARIEVYIDFPDEDLPDSLQADILGRIATLHGELEAAIADSRRGRQVREGYRIVILGEPNAGKSSLFNALLKAEAAIVTPIAGTTRDIIEAQLRIGPYTVLLYDTAGLRETDEIVEAEGIRRARNKAEEADLRIWVVDGTRADIDIGDVRAEDLLVFNKADLAPAPDVSRETLAVSLTTAQGVDNLIATVERRVTAELSTRTFPAATRQRHIDRLSEARQELDAALARRMRVPELTAEHIRQAVNAFDALFGKYDVEGVLDVVFSTFCIGK
ncbi:tRNA uridine-5-carboxymethylaminomethyl(34) synthesis GTPase MnmE [Asticcacaulis solisilvae]|uniref:tRNA uridine-5-carboxymethylaminomethyl(34) synthesis GTPase MnmE n=1 Tax=Asticcacaulis solisilvae TaxID=1217274 RepID=UPI003FD8EBD3